MSELQAIVFDIMLIICIIAMSLGYSWKIRQLKDKILILEKQIEKDGCSHKWESITNDDGEFTDLICSKCKTRIDPFMGRP